MRVELWQGYCHECGWWGDQYPTEEAADMEADEHDEEVHGELES